MSRANNPDIYSRFEAEYEDVVSIALSGVASFAKQAQSVPKFLQKYAILCVENPTTISVDNRFNILNNLRSLSIEILKNYPQQIDTEEGAVAQFFRNEVNRESEEITVDFNGMIQSLQDMKNIKDVTSIEDANGFYYYTILEHYILIANNLAYTCLEQENFSTALNLIIKTIECWRLMQYNSYYLRYQISTVLINLASLVEEDYKIEASQLLCNSALHLENLEMEIDADAESIQIYEFISDRASQFLFLLRSKDDKQSFAQQKFCYRKSFLLARLCMVYAYYADFLVTLGKKQEGDFARKHANILKKELEKKEEQSLSVINTPKKEEKSTSKHHKSGTASHSSSRPTTALTATATTNFSQNSKVSKENIIFQKHLQIHGKKYRVIVVSVNDFDCLEMIAYDKPNNKLFKLFIHFQEVLDFAKKNDLDTSSDEEMAALFSKLTKKLYIKENNLCLKDVTFFPRIEDLKISSLL